jgi:hypothetical protein
MNRRGFIGALAALVSLPVGAFVARSVPGFTANGYRLRFDPFGELDWIDLPSRITGLEVLNGTNLLIRCIGGLYILTHAGGPLQDWSVREVREWQYGKQTIVI